MSSLSSDQPEALSDFTLCHEAVGKTGAEFNIAVGYVATVVHRTTMMFATCVWRRLTLTAIVQKVLYTYRRPAEQAAIPLGTNPLKKRLQESWIAAESVSSHSA